VPSGARVYIWEIASGDMHAIDTGTDGQFTLSVPFSEHAHSAQFLLSYATAAGGSGGRAFSPQIKLGVAR